ncbi:MAG: hypothetical protein R2831_10560 [Chitinophagaceae bacterium]
MQYYTTPKQVLKLGLDGELLTDNASFNTSALTGESKPDTKAKGETALAGMINLNTVAQVRKLPQHIRIVS